MNDFTKEELEELKECIGWTLGEGQGNPDTIFNLEAKLQSLINNYCEHDTGECIGGSIQCHKCGETWQ